MNLVDYNPLFEIIYKEYDVEVLNKVILNNNVGDSMKKVQISIGFSVNEFNAKQYVTNQMFKKLNMELKSKDNVVNKKKL
jgi:hypothetical protein